MTEDYHIIPAQEGEAIELEQVVTKPSAAQIDKRIVYPEADGWREQSTAGIERFLFGAATKIVSADFDFDEETIILGDATGGNITGTLPPVATSKNRIYFAKKIEPVQSSKRFTVAAQPGEFIDHASSVSLSTRDEFIGVISDATRWRIIAVLKRLAYPPGFVRGARLSYISASSVSIGTVAKDSFVRDNADSFNHNWAGILTADITISGPGGLQTGSIEAANEWLGVHVIGDTTEVNPIKALLIPDGTAFSEAGYDVNRRLGWVRNKARNFIRFDQTGIDSERVVLYDVASVQTVLQNGTATSFTPVDLKEFIPPTSQWALCHFEFLGSSASSDFGIKPSNFVNSLRFTAPLISQPSYTPVGQEVRKVLWTMTDENQSIDYILSSSSSELDIAPAGWKEYL